jgi:murein DD-endopeptidase
MKIRWEKIFGIEQAQFEKMTEQQKFQYFLLLQFGSPYGWGKENPVESDCSGAVCLALYAATGYLVRTTADDLFKRYFTLENPTDKMIRAAFWITQWPQNHGGTVVPEGTATHIAGIVGRGVVLSSEEPYAVVSTIPAVPPGGRIVATRGLNMAYLASRSGKDIYDLDPVFRECFEAQMQKIMGCFIVLLFLGCTTIQPVATPSPVAAEYRELQADIQKQ